MSLLRSYLEANSILSSAQLEVATRHQQAQGGSLDTALLELGLLGAADLDLHLGRACGLPTVPARLLETGPTRPWGHVPKALLDIGWAMPLALEDGNVLVAVHPDLPDARLGQLYRQIRGFMPMVAPECCLAKLAAERSNGIVAPRFAMLMLDVLDALQARDAGAGAQPVPEDMPGPAEDTSVAIQPPTAGDTLLASAIRRLPAEDASSSGTFSAASSGTFSAVSLGAHESGSFSASSSGTFPDLRSVGAHAPGTRHGPEPTPGNGPPVPQALKPAAVATTTVPAPSTSLAAPATQPAPVPSASLAAPATQPAPAPSTSLAAPATQPAPAPSASLAAPATQPAPAPSASLASAAQAPAVASTSVSSASPSPSPAAPAQPVSSAISSAAPASRPNEPRGWQAEPPSPESERAAQLAQRLAPARAVLAAAIERDRITEALVRAAVQIAPRVALFGVRREGLRVLPSPGALELPRSLVIPIPEGSLLDRAVLGLIRLKLLTEPKLAAAVGRPLGIPCLFEPVFAQERGVLMLYIDRDGGQFDAIDHTAVRDLCDLASANLEALLRTRGVTTAPKPPVELRGAPAVAAGSTAELSPRNSTPEATDPHNAAHPAAATPVPADSPAAAPGPAASAPVPADSPAASAPVPADSPAALTPTVAASAPVPADSPAALTPAVAASAPVPADSPAATPHGGAPDEPGKVGQPRPEVDVPQQRPGRAARAAKRQVISLVNPIRRDNSGGHGAPSTAHVELRANEAIPDPQRSSQPLASPAAPSPQPVPADRPEPSAPTTSAQPVPADRPEPGAPAAAAQPVLTDRPEPGAPTAATQPVPADRPLTDAMSAQPGSAAPVAPAGRDPSAPLERTSGSDRSSAIVSGVIVDRTPAGRDSSAPLGRVSDSGRSSVIVSGVNAPSDTRAITRAEPQVPPATAPAEPAASPAATATAEPAAPTAATPSPAEPPPSPPTEPQTSPSPAAPAELQGPLTTTSPVESQTPAGSPVPADSLAAAPPGLHLPNLVAPPGRRGLGRKGDRTRHEAGLVMPDLRRPSAAGTPTLSIPTSLIAPTPLPGAQRRGSRTGLYPVPPRADEITLNMPRLVRDDVAARPSAPAADLSSGTAAISPLAGVVIPAELTRKPASTPSPAAPALPSVAPAQPAGATDTADAAPAPTATELSADTSTTELSAETSATAAVIEAIADAMSAAAQAADREDHLSFETAPASAHQAAALGSDAAAPQEVDADAVIEAYLNDPADAGVRAALGQLSSRGLERIAARFPGPIDLGDQSDARSFPPPSAHGPLLRACVEIGPAITTHILALLEYPRPQLRFYAAFVFQELRDPRCMRSLAEHAFDPDADVRLIATRVLESYSRVEGFVAATELVRAELRSRDRDRALLAAEAAGTLRDTQAVYTLIELLSVRDKQVRETALEALCSITAKHLGYRPAKWRAWYDEHGQETRVEWVIEALRHRDAAVRRWAADELVRITGHRVTAPAGEKMTAKYLYQAWQQWWAAGTADRGS